MTVERQKYKREFHYTADGKRQFVSETMIEVSPHAFVNRRSAIALGLAKVSDFAEDDNKDVAA